MILIFSNISALKGASRALSLSLVNAGIRDALGALFTWKFLPPACGADCAQCAFYRPVL